MKSYQLIIVEIFSIVLLNPVFNVESISTNIYDESQWVIQDIEFTGDGSLYIDSTIGVEDNLYISYFDRDINSLKVIFIQGDNMVFYVVDSDDVGEFSSIKVDSDDFLHVSYFDSTNNDLKYAYWNGVDWNVEVVDSSGNVGLYTCIDVDSFNHPHISYYDEDNGDLKYCYWDGIDWNFEIVVEEGDIGLGTSLVIDSNNVPHISFTDKDKNFLYYAKKPNSNWEITLVDNSCDVFGSTSIDVDNGNFAHISYFDVGIIDEDWNLKHAYYDGSDWFDEIVDPDLKYFWNDWGVSIVIDDFDRIHIGYYCWFKWDLKYAYKINDKWSVETVESDGDSGAYASIVVNSKNYPIIAYMSRSTVALKYAIKTQYSPDPPDKPSGPSNGKPDEIYSFKATGNDFDGDSVKYGWDWGDGSEIEWTDFFSSGEAVQVEHSWSEKATYNVKVKVVDTNEYESDWSDPLIIRMPKVKTILLFYLNIERLIQRFQIF